MKEDYTAGPNRTAGGMTNGTFRADAGPMKKEAEDPAAKRMKGSPSPTPSNSPSEHDAPLMSKEDMAVRDISTLEYLRSHPEFIALGLGGSGSRVGGSASSCGSGGG